MAEGILRKLVGDRLHVYSAGLNPDRIHPLVEPAMQELGIDITGQRSKGVQEYLRQAHGPLCGCEDLQGGVIAGSSAGCLRPTLSSARLTTPRPTTKLLLSAKPQSPPLLPRQSRLELTMTCSFRFRLFAAVLIVATPALLAAAGEPTAWPWQDPKAQVLPTGDLEWKPQPFVYVAGESIRYIDYEGGNDANPGTREQPWQHHPWDPAATGQAAAAKGIDTYVFKRGVIYRGGLVVRESGKPGHPIRLTSDPAWGARRWQSIVGSEHVTGWRRGAHPKMPEPDKVWNVDLDFAPRNVWMIRGDGGVVRIPLARTPNWQPCDPDDIKSEWFQFNNPDNRDVWGAKERLGGAEYPMGYDTVNLTHDADYYKDAVIRCEYGWVMGTPYPSHVLKFDPVKHSLTFGGQWGGGIGAYHYPRHVRYYLEDKPQYLDDGSSGRVLVRQTGRRRPALSPPSRRRRPERRPHRGRQTHKSHRQRRHEPRPHLRTGHAVHQRLVRPDGAAEQKRRRGVHPPAGAGTRPGGGQLHVRARPPAYPLQGRGQGRRHRRRGHPRQPDPGHRPRRHYPGRRRRWGDEYTPGRLLDVKVLRNRLHEIGHRTTRYGQGHAIEIEPAETAEVAGNILDRLYGAGIFVFGGKQSVFPQRSPPDPHPHPSQQGGRLALEQQRLGRHRDLAGRASLRVRQHFRQSGRIQAVVGDDPWDRGKNPDSARFGHAYYMDGGFKQYYFNNIAWGKSKDPFDRLGNTAAFQEIIGYSASIFNNTVYNFVNGSRRQVPDAGRNKYMGNIWQGIGHMVFRHADPKDLPADPNAADAKSEASDYHHALQRLRLQRVLRRAQDVGRVRALGALAWNAGGFPPCPGDARLDRRRGRNGRPAAAARRGKSRFPPHGGGPRQGRPRLRALGPLRHRRRVGLLPCRQRPDADPRRSFPHRPRTSLAGTRITRTRPIRCGP